MITLCYAQNRFIYENWDLKNSFTLPKYIAKKILSFHSGFKYILFSN
jgi:hypothetical protein